MNKRRGSGGCTLGIILYKTTQLTVQVLVERTVVPSTHKPQHTLAAQSRRPPRTPSAPTSYLTAARSSRSHPSPLLPPRPRPSRICISRSRSRSRSAQCCHRRAAREATKPTHFLSQANTLRCTPTSASAPHLAYPSSATYCRTVLNYSIASPMFQTPLHSATSH